MKKWKMILTLFSEIGGGESAAAAEAPAADSGAAGSENVGVEKASPTGRSESGRRPKLFPNVPKADGYGQQRRRQAPTPQAVQNAQQTAAEPETWDSLIKGRYKEEYGKSVQAAVQERFKNQQDLSARLEKQNGLVSAVARIYGVQAAEDGSYDLDVLSNKLTTDKRFYEDEALEKGIPVETVMELAQAKAYREQQEQQKRVSMQQEMAQRHVANLRAQEAELKRDYPDFDLMEAAKNAEFRRMTSPGGGLSVRQAYMAVFGEEIARRSAENAARTAQQQARQNMSRAIQSGTARVQENGILQSGGGSVQRDGASYTREERAEIRRRARSGEHVRI